MDYYLIDNFVHSKHSGFLLPANVFANLGPLPLIIYVSPGGTAGLAEAKPKEKKLQNP